MNNIIDTNLIKLKLHDILIPMIMVAIFFIFNRDYTLKSLIGGILFIVLLILINNQINIFFIKRNKK